MQSGLTTPSESRHSGSGDKDHSDILKPLDKKQVWEMKEKATNSEVTLQYTIIKLEEQKTAVHHKLDSLRKECSELTDVIKNNY